MLHTPFFDKRKIVLKKIFIFLFSALFISACQNFLPKTATLSTVPTSTATELPLPTQTPFPTMPAPSVSSELQGVTIKNGATPDFIEATGSQPSAPGTYIIYMNNRGEIRYVSLDGQDRNTLFDLDFEKFYYIPDLPSPKGIQLLAGENPKIALSPLANHSHIEEHNILFVDIAGNPIQTWRLIPEDWGCFTPSFSPQGNFALIECMEPDRYLNLINLENNVEKSYHLPSCGSEAVHAMPITWAYNGKNFLYHCNDYRNVYCFISTNNEQPTCKSVQIKDLNDQTQQPRILSISPDWSKIAFDMGYQSADENGFILGYRVFVASATCVIEEEICSDITVVDLPFAYPYNPNAERAKKPSLQIIWSPTDNKLVWNTSSKNNDAIDKRSIVGIYDLATKENRFFRVWDTSIKIISISPDGEWLLYEGIEFTPSFDGSEHYYVTSLKNGRFHSVISSREFEPTQGGAVATYIEFYGWLTIP